jgi:hypothetical protein
MQSLHTSEWLIFWPVLNEVKMTRTRSIIYVCRAVPLYIRDVVPAMNVDVPSHSYGRNVGVLQAAAWVRSVFSVRIGIPLLKVSLKVSHMLRLSPHSHKTTLMPVTMAWASLLR